MEQIDIFGNQLITQKKSLRKFQWKQKKHEQIKLMEGS